MLMRTTIELPDALFRRAKIAAVERGLTLKALISEGLQRVLEESSARPDTTRLPKLPKGGRKSYDLSNEEIESLLIAEDAKRYGRAR
jgi:hypothetical protein